MAASIATKMICTIDINTTGASNSPNTTELADNGRLFSQREQVRTDQNRGALARPPHDLVLESADGPRIKSG